MNSVLQRQGVRHHSEYDRTAAIIADPVLQARAKPSDNKVSGLADAEKIYTITKCFHERFMGSMEPPNSGKIVQLLFLRKPNAQPRKGIKGYRPVALSSVMSTWYASCVMMLIEGERAPESWGRLLVGGINNTSCQHLQVMLTNLLQKHWVLQEHRDSMMKHGCVVRPTMFLASLDIKTVFDDARPRHVAKLMEGHSIHRWLISALMSEMSDLHERATFECVDSVFVFNRCLQFGFSVMTRH